MSSPSSPWDRGALARELDRLAGAGLLRAMRRVESAQHAEVVLDGRRVINFSGNNTLGLANHPALRAAAGAALDRFGAGAGASRLISGNMTPHEDLEQAAAAFVGKEGALFFSSGYSANSGAIPALAFAEREAVILSDELNHASLIDGIRLSRAERRIYAHNDAGALAAELRSIPAGAPVLVVTESLFSMEGDRAPLKDIAALKAVRPFLLFVDEAHAVGAIGPGGRGLAAEAGCLGEVDVLIATLGKALGAAGAFAAARADLIALLVNRARPFIYSTAPMPAMAAAAAAAIRLAPECGSLRERLRCNAAMFRRRLAEVLGLEAPGRDHIVPVACAGAERVMNACAALLAQGVFCQGIRPPTVPPGACRLRFAISALHTEDHIEKAVAALAAALAGR